MDSETEATKILTMDFSLKAPAYSDDVGIDIRSAARHVIKPGQFARVFSNTCMAMDRGKWGLVIPRSGANSSGVLVVLPGVIDPGYRGPLGAFVHNVYRPTVIDWIKYGAARIFKGKEASLEGTIVIDKGSSVAQLVIMHSATPYSILYVNKLPESHRGLNGFNSSGNGHESI